MLPPAVENISVTFITALKEVKYQNIYRYFSKYQIDIFSLCSNYYILLKCHTVVSSKFIVSTKAIKETLIYNHIQIIDF